jgi:hypothetical protein
VHREYWNSDTDAILTGLKEMADLVRSYERQVGAIIENLRLQMMEAKKIAMMKEEVV